MNVGRRERNQQDATNLMFIIKLYLNMFRASLCPSSGEQECSLPHMVFCTGCDGCGCVELGCELCALWKLLFDIRRRVTYAAVHTLVLLMLGIMMPETCWSRSLIINIKLVDTVVVATSGMTVKCVRRTVTFTVHIAHIPAPHNHSHHNQCRTPYAAVHTLVLLMMGVMMPETCWDRSLIINIKLVDTVVVATSGMRVKCVRQCWVLSKGDSLLCCKCNL